MKICSVSSCGRVVLAKQLCRKHYDKSPLRQANIKKLKRSDYEKHRSSILKQKQEYYAANQVKILKRKAEYHIENREANKAKSKRYYQQNTAYFAEYKREYYAEKGPLVRARRKAYRKRNLGKCNAADRKRRIAKMQRVPKWADLKAIASFYANCPPGYHVDHIIPLQGKNVSGLHVLSNLQYLPAAENIRKRNKFEPIQGLGAINEIKFRRAG